MVAISQARGAAAAPLFGEYATAGDSLIAGGYAGSSLAQRVAMLSGGRFRLRRGFAAGGKRSDQVLAEQVPSVIASGLKVVILNTGVTNDIAQAVSEATARANTIAIWTALRDAGVLLVDVGMMPNAVSGANALRHADHELWRRQYCARNGIIHIDAFIPLATASGGWISGYNFDDLHPNSIAADLIALRIIDALDKPRSVHPLLELIDRADGNTVITRNAVSFGGTGAALPTGYFSSGTGPTYSVVAADGGQQNNWIRATFAGANAQAGFTGTGKSFANLGWTVGDVVAMGVLLRWTTTAADAMKPRLQLNNAGASALLALPYDEWGGATGESIYAYGEFVVANATCNMNFLAVPTAAGNFEISRPIAYNLTANGLA